ncbi:MAG: hypothetical protein Ct9H300mP27_05800 [Chloroflexota bacterium]|nr:MAG: hypothetical protein Ct9H300mP27_05800 [Chloroflexota bacterium]
MESVDGPADVAGFGNEKEVEGKTRQVWVKPGLLIFSHRSIQLEMIPKEFRENERPFFLI